MAKEIVDRVKTGIAGLDKALNGGIPKGNLVLVSGGAGTGKSTLCLQFLVNGALNGQKGLYVSTEQARDELHRQAACFGWDLESLEKKGLLEIVFLDITKGDNPLEKIFDAYNAFNPDRLAIDSLTSLTDMMLISGVTEETAFSMVQVAESVSPIPRTDTVVAKSILYQLIGKLKLFGITVMLSSELLEEGHGLSADEVSEFICDGVIILHYLGVGSAEFRSLQIRKMRYSGHEKGYLMYKISPKGIDIVKEEIFKV